MSTPTPQETPIPTTSSSIAPAAEPWTLTDTLRETLDSRVKSFLESLDAAQAASPQYAKALEAWRVSRRARSASLFTEVPATASSAEEAAGEEEESHAEGRRAEEEVQGQVREMARSEGPRERVRKTSCTVDGACLRDVWLRGSVVIATAAFLLLS